MTEQDLLSDCLRRLNKLEVVYYLTGSMASNYWGIPRTTHDLDFVIHFAAENVDALVAAFRGDYYVDEASVAAVFRPPHQFNLIDTRSALKVDFWLVRPAPFDQQMLGRRISADINGVQAWIASAEDVILHKLIWNRITPSDRQLRDAAGVWAVQRDSIDRSYMESWASELGVSETLANIFSGNIRPKAT